MAEDQPKPLKGEITHGKGGKFVKGFSPIWWCPEASYAFSQLNMRFSWSAVSRPDNDRKIGTTGTRLGVKNRWRTELARD